MDAGRRKGGRWGWLGLSVSCVAALTGSGVGSWVWLGGGLKILFHLLCHGQGISPPSLILSTARDGEVVTP